MCGQGKRKGGSSHDPADPLVIPLEYDPVHLAENCLYKVDPTCPCHEDQELIAEIAAKVEAGELTASEATAIVNGTAC